MRQAKATLQQARAALDQALANLEQGKANMELARVTAERWARLVARGVVSRQENDQYQAQYQAQVAGVQSLEKAVSAQRSNVAQAEANVARLDEMQGYRLVKAPFEGVITLRNVDVGRAGERGQHAAVPHRADGHAAHLRERAADECEHDTARANGAVEGLESARARVHGHGGAHGECARSRPAARCWWKSRCRMRMARCCRACTRRCG